MIEFIEQIDHALTLVINSLHNGGLDVVMQAISGRLTWIPLYLLLVFLLFRSVSLKSFLFVLGAVVITIVLRDQVSVFMKNSIGRYRPCHNLLIQGSLHLTHGCGGKFGFVSSHAANTMGLAVLIALILKKNWVSTVMLTFALLNAYSRVYLGKHYLGDVVGGIILGAAIAMLVVATLKRLLTLEYK